MSAAEQMRINAKQAAIAAGNAVLRGEGDGTYSEAEDAIRLLIAAAAMEPAGTTKRGKWRERWHGSEPQRGSAIVDEAGNLLAYLGGDRETHAVVTALVAAHNSALAEATAQVSEVN